MSGRRQPDVEAIERRLAARADHAPPGHRDRVLAAVRDTLAGRFAPRATPTGLDAVALATVATLAISALVAVVAPWLVVTQALTLPSPEPRLVAQARAAGIDLPVHLAATTRGPHDTPLFPPSERSPGRRSDAWQLRTLLTGEL